jgi:hypothetical protein
MRCINGEGHPRSLHTTMYARHGHELRSCKSSVNELSMRICIAEALAESKNENAKFSEGSRSAGCESTDRNVAEGLVPGQAVTQYHRETASHDAQNHRPLYGPRILAEADVNSPRIKAQVSKLSIWPLPASRGNLRLNKRLARIKSSF